MQTDVAIGNAFTSYIQATGDILTGWSSGVTGSGHYRITQNAYTVSDATSTAFYINSSTRNVGIGTDAPRDKLEVNGNVTIGNKLTFGGLSGDEYGNTIIQERIYSGNPSLTQSELLLFKGNEGILAGSPNEGPDRIRYIAPEHIFQTYNTGGETFQGIVGQKDGETNIPLIVNGSGLVVVGGRRTDYTDTINNPPIGVNTRLLIAGDIEFRRGGSFIFEGLKFISNAVTGINLIRNTLNGTQRRTLGFSHQLDTTNEYEFARFDQIGNLGIGTTTIASNVHIYNGNTTSQTLLKLESPGTNKETGMLLCTSGNEGGFVRGFSNSENSTTGLVMGVSNNSVLTNCLHMIQSSNVGIGTAKPATKFHIYNGIPRIESASSNAIVEFKTIAGTSTIFSGTNGNVYIQPYSSNTFIKGNLETSGNLTVKGAIDLGNQVGIGLGTSTANTALHVNGGIITNSDQVACKKYSTTFSIDEFNDKRITFYFGNSSFYDKDYRNFKTR